MIELFTSNSVAFLGVLARWLLSPVPFAFIGLAALTIVFGWFWRVVR